MLQPTRQLAMLEHDPPNSTRLC